MHSRKRRWRDYQPYKLSSFFSLLILFLTLIFSFLHFTLFLSFVLHWCINNAIMVVLVVFVCIFFSSSNFQEKYAFITVCCFFQEILRLSHHISIEHNHIYNKVWYYIYIAFHIGTFFWLGYSTCILFSGKDKPIAFPFYIDKHSVCVPT